MSSWLSGLSASVGDLSNKVQAALPVDKEMLQKLTLTTPEMNAERQVQNKSAVYRYYHYIYFDTLFNFICMYIYI
jgi:hypothetical protein